MATGLLLILFSSCMQRFVNASCACVLQDMDEVAPEPDGPTSFAEVEGLLGHFKGAASSAPLQRPSSKPAAGTLLGLLQAQAQSGRLEAGDGAAVLAMLQADRRPKLPANFAKLLQRT